MARAARTMKRPARPLSVVCALPALAVLAAATAGTWAAAPAPTSVGAAAAQPVLVVALPADIRSTNPGVDRDDATDGVLLHVVEGLVGYRENGSVGPLLAQDVARSGDGRSYTFRLRKGVKFHNGAPLTSAEVAWSWRRYMDPKTQWRCLAEFDGRGAFKVTDVSTPDPYTIVLRLDKPSALFLDTLARTDCGMAAVLHPASVKADGSWDRPIGTGPFMFSDWKRGESVTLGAFKDYQSPPGSRPDGYTGLKQALVDSVRFSVASGPAATRDALASGTADAGPISTTEAQELTFGTSYNARLAGRAVAGSAPRPGEAVKVLIARQANKNALLLQTRDPVLKDERIRRAIAMALDTRALVAVASEGMAAVNPSAVPLGSSYHTAVHKNGVAHDPVQARKLLAQAGYRGEKITIQANQRANVPSHTIALRAQAMLREVGVAAEVEVLDWPVQLERYAKGDFQISSFTYSPRLDPGLSYEQFTGNKNAQARKVWDDPAARRLVEASLAESDPKNRQALFDEAHALMLKQVPLVLLYNGIDTWGVRRRVSGFSVWEGKPRAWNTRVGAQR